MQRDNAEGQVSVGDALEARLAHPSGEFVLRGPLLDRLVQIAVGLCRLAVHEAGHPRQHVSAVEPVGHADRLRGRCRELCDHDATTGLDHTKHLGERLARLMHIAQAVRDGGRVEAVVFEGQCSCVGEHELDEVVAGVPLTPLGEHAFREVSCDHVRTMFRDRRT